MVLNELPPENLSLERFSKSSDLEIDALEPLLFGWWVADGGRLVPGRALLRSTALTFAIEHIAATTVDRGLLTDASQTGLTPQGRNAALAGAGQQLRVITPPVSTSGQGNDWHLGGAMPIATLHPRAGAPSHPAPLLVRPNPRAARRRLAATQLARM